MDIVNEHIARFRGDIADVIVCKDGFSMSVQGSRNHYCNPRNDLGPYERVEIGFPSAIEPLITEYAECSENLTGTVYGWVPVSVVLAVIEKHGGI